MGQPNRYSVLVLQKVRENSWNLSTFSLLLEELNTKNPRRFVFSFEHAKFVLILKFKIVPYGSPPVVK